MPVNRRAIAVDASELKHEFSLAFNDEMLRFLAQHIHDSYPDAIERAASLEREFQRRVVPQIRHFIVQSRVRYLAKRFPQVTATTARSDGHEPYTVLRSGKFFLTVSMAEEAGQLPRKSNFRQANATDNLFERINPEEVENCYAILSHVPSHDNRAPEHLSVLFPDDNYGVYGCINLSPLIDFDLEQTQTPNELIEVPEPTLRKRLPKKQEEA
jgi:hypothetical protein